MKKIAATIGFLSVLLAMLGITPSVAQNPQFPQNLPANTVIGRTGIGAGPAQAIPFSQLGLLVSGFQSILPLQANTTLFVDGLNGNDSNSGLAAGTGNAWATFAPVYKYLCYTHIGNGFSATIQVANASSIAGAGGIGGAFLLNCTPLGYPFIILNLGGGTLTPASGFDAVQVAMSMMASGFATPALHVTNGTITCSGGGAGVHSIAGDVVIESFGGTLTFGTCTGGTHVFADGNHARIFINTGYTISGNAANHLVAFAAGGIDYNTTATITCTGSPVFSGAFASAGIGSGWVYVPSGTISFSGCGTVTGARYSASNNGTIITNGGGANFFPGNSAGGVALGGRYDSPGTPLVSACGTSPGSPVGTDQAGSVVEGTTATGCTWTFTTTNTPKACEFASSNAALTAGIAVTVLNATTLTITHPSTSGATVYWNCPAP